MDRRGLLSAFFCVLCLALTGCTAGTLAPSTTTPAANTHASGSVFGGQQPVVGASIQLYTVGTTADGSAAAPLLTQTVTSDAHGSFSITGLYSCTSATQVYIVATGGNPGLSTTNPNIALMAALGPCSALSPSTFISINELTTVAAVSALAPYMSSVSAIGSSTSDTTALANAFTFANQLVNTATGTAPGVNLPPGATVPVDQLNTLADIAAACINSTGGTAGDGSLCGTLFSLTTITPNPAPTNTISALLNLANNPTLNTSALFALTPPAPPFQPTLTSAPPNFQIGLTPPAGGAALQISPSSIAFPGTAVSFTSQPQTVTIQNTGSSAVTFNSIAITGANASDFAINNSKCLATLDAGDSCTFQVSATPAANGTRNASLAVNSTSPESPQSVPLSVNGTAPSAGPVSLSSNSLSFTLAGLLQDVTVSNYGNTPLTIGSITVTSGTSYFNVSNSTCGSTLPAQSVCTISVASTFAVGDSQGQPITQTGTITILDDASTGPQTISLASRNLGFIGTADSRLGVITFPASQVGATQTVQAGYSGYNAYDEAGWPSISPGLTGLNPSDFSETITQSTSIPSGRPLSSCTPALYGQANCIISFTFTPSASGPRSAKAIFPSGQYLLLQGTGQGSGPSFSVTDAAGFRMGSNLPSTVDPNSVGKDTLTVTNTGTTTMSFGATFSGAGAPFFTVDTSQCQSVPAQSSCSVNITFLANAVGSYPATLFLFDKTSAAASNFAFTASTSYWSPLIRLSQNPFPAQAINTVSAPASFTVTDGAGSYALPDPITLTLPSNSNFTLPNGSSCPPGPPVCTLTVAFSPHVVGPVSEMLTATDTVTGLSYSANLLGTGTGTPGYTLSSASVTFASRSVNTTSIPTVVMLTSNGTQSLSVSGISISGAVNNNFTQTNNCSNVPVNSTCNINITFAPTAAGTQTATVQITSNATSPNTISLTGTATSP